MAPLGCDDERMLSTLFFDPMPIRGQASLGMLKKWLTGVPGPK
jgi:hypothetical protein